MRRGYDGRDDGGSAGAAWKVKTDHHRERHDYWEVVCEYYADTAQTSCMRGFLHDMFYFSWIAFPISLFLYALRIDKSSLL